MQQVISQLGASSWSLFIGALSLLLIWAVTEVLERVWFRPKRLERALRNQGLRGTVYRSLDGDLKEENRLIREARAKPTPLTHDVVPRVAPMLDQTMKEFGKQSFTWVGPMPQVTIRNPELVKEIMSNKLGHFQKQQLGPLGRVLTEGVLKYEGEKWAKHRRILNPAFHVEKLKRMQPAFSTCCDELVGRWKNLAGPDGSFELDVWQEMQNFTGDVISRTAFGSSYQEGRRIFQLQRELTERVISARRTSIIPSISWYLPTENNRRMKQISREIEALIMRIITKREKALRDGEPPKDDLLGVLLESNRSEMAENGEPDSSLGMTTREVIQECKLFYIAGQGTTRVLLTWAVIVLSMHPEWQEKAREEVVRHFARNKPDFDGLSRLKIVTMILYEVLRLYPPIAMLNRETCKPIQLSDDLTLPSGVLVGLPILCIHHDPEAWGTDASEFKPTRFAGGISKATKDGQLAFVPFGWGPRVCIGQNFALLEAKMGLSTILQHFEFELSDQYRHAPCTVLTLQPEHGAPIKFRRI